MNMDPVFVPEMKKGWLMKQGRNLFKSWKKRYFVLEAGLLSYYESETEKAPYGIKLKGQMSLRGARLDVYFDTGGVRDDNRLYIAGSGSENDMLLEGTTPFEMGQWSVKLDQHIKFANEYPELALFREDDERCSTNELIRENGRNIAASPMESASEHNGLSSPSLSKAWDAENLIASQKANSHFEPIVFTPTPGFVVKTRNGAATKIFVNIVSHPAVPPSDKKRGNKMWPLMIFGEERASIDKAGDNCSIVDVIVSPSLIQECAPDTDEGEAVREAVILKVIESLQKKDPTVSDDFSIPKISKKYKGDTIPSAVLTVAHLMPYGRKFVQQKAQEEAKNNPGPETSVEDSPSDKKSSLKMKMLGVGKKDSGFAGVVKAVIPAQQKPAPLVPQRPQRHIPYVVIRPGALVQSKPEKGSGRVAKLTNNSKVYANTKKEDRSRKGFYWIKIENGWVPCTTEGGQRILQPTFDNSSPVAISIVSTSFADPPPAGFWESVFFFLSTRLTFQVVFTIEVSFQRGAVLKIKRNLSSLCTIRETILNNGGEPARKMQDLESRKRVRLPCEMDGDEVLLEGGMDLVDFVEQVGQWLSAMGVGTTTDFPPLTDFFCPVEEDIELMENELQAEGGFEGAWFD